MRKHHKVDTSASAWIKQLFQQFEDDSIFYTFCETLLVISFYIDISLKDAKLYNFENEENWIYFRTHVHSLLDFSKFVYL